MSHVRASWRTFRGFALAFFAGACSTPTPTLDLNTNEGRTLDLNTEIASFFLFHPDDLQHRKASPSLWTIYDFAVAPEFAAGNLVSFDTGADGGFRIRLTEGGLTPREKKLYSCSWSFRYVVRHGRVLIDNGDHVPSDPSDSSEGVLPDVSYGPGPIPDEQWFAVPNGNFMVTVSAIDWEEEPGAVDSREHATKNALPAYVIQFRKVDRLDTIKAARCPPRLEPGREGDSMFSPITADQTYQTGEDTEGTVEPLPKTCPVVVVPTLLLVPGFDTGAVTLPDSEAARLQFVSDDRPTASPTIALVDSEQSPRLGVLGAAASMSGQEGGSWKVSFRLDRLVNVTKIEKVDGGLVATLADVTRPKSEVPPGDLAAIKASFATYAKSNEAYRRAVKFPDYEAERVGAMSSPSAISSTLLHHVVVPAATRARLLPLSDAARIGELLAILKSSRDG